MMPQFSGYPAGPFPGRGVPHWGAPRGMPIPRGGMPPTMPHPHH